MQWLVDWSHLGTNGRYLYEVINDIFAVYVIEPWKLKLETLFVKVLCDLLSNEFVVHTCCIVLAACRERNSLC